MRNIALILMYNGTAYHGWQVQKTEVTVAQTLERGLSMVCGEPVKCTGCGPPDAGVHAEHYVANFRTSSRIPVDRIPFAVNTRIPEDIVVKAAYEVAEDFNAIGSCLEGVYLSHLQFTHQESLLCGSGVFLSQAAGRAGDGPGGTGL